MSKGDALYQSCQNPPIIQKLKKQLNTLNNVPKSKEEANGHIQKILNE